jgi:hypothetical protein
VVAEVVVCVCVCVAVVLAVVMLSRAHREVAIDIEWPYGQRGHR